MPRVGGSWKNAIARELTPSPQVRQGSDASKLRRAPSPPAASAAPAAVLALVGPGAGHRTSTPTAGTTAPRGPIRTADRDRGGQHPRAPGRDRAPGRRRRAREARRRRSSSSATRRSSSRSPGAPFPLQRLAQLYRERGRQPREARRRTSRRARRRPGADQYAATVSLAGIYKIDGRADDAIKTYEKAIALKGERPDGAARARAPPPGSRRRRRARATLRGGARRCTPRRPTRSRRSAR